MKESLHSLLQKRRSVLLPVAHDALTARIIQKVGFEAFAVGGFSIAASRFGMPDFGIVSYREMRDATAEIVRSVGIPALVDGDGGYGDFLNVERLVREYEKEDNISAVFLEDQEHPKRCGHLRGKRLVAPEDMVRKIQTAVRTRTRQDLLIMARTDARSMEGLDSALKRAEMYRKAGADILFIEAPESVEELATIGETFKGTPLLVNMLEGGKTPILPRHELEQLGFALIAYPVTSLLVMTHALEHALTELKTTGDTLGIQRTGMTDMSTFHDLIGVTEALAKEETLLKEIRA